MTLEGLLSHTAGLTVHGFPGYVAGTPVPTLVQVLDGTPPANTAPIRVDLDPGTRYRYSGGGYTIAQLAMMDVSGQPFPRLLADTVLRPLGMVSSTFEQPLPEARVGEARRATARTARRSPASATSIPRWRRRASGRRPRISRASRSRFRRCAVGRRARCRRRWSRTCSSRAATATASGSRSRNGAARRTSRTAARTRGFRLSCTRTRTGATARSS